VYASSDDENKNNIERNLTTTETDKNKNSNKSETSIDPVTSLFEGAVQQITGNTEYKFGDVTKKSMSMLTGKDVEKEGYEFGDVSKNIATAAGRKISGKEDYEFGDITRDKLSDLNENLGNLEAEILRESNVSFLFQNMLKGLDAPQRNAFIFQAVQVAAVVLLTWGLISNICTIFSISAAWTYSCFAHLTGTASSLAADGGMSSVTGSAANSALASTIFGANKDLRINFWVVYMSLRVVMDPFFFVIKGAGTVRFFLNYQRFIQTIEQTWISSSQRENYPRLHRVVALGIVFFMHHVVCSFFASLTAMFIGSNIARLLVN